MERLDDSRLRGVVLAVSALAALAVGRWWWVASAPEVSPAAAAAAAPSATLDAPPLLDTGPRSGVVVDPQTGRWLGVGPTSGYPQSGYSQERVQRALPSSPDAVWREVMTLREATSAFWQIPAHDGDRYLLQYVCSGSGRVRVATQNTAESASRVATPCDSSLVSSDLLARGDMEVSAARLGTEPIVIGIQLVRVHR